MKKKILLFILTIFCIYFSLPSNADAAASSGISGNGTGGIYIDINASPYTNFANKSHGTTSGCAWFASARAYQLTGKGSANWSGQSFWDSQYAIFGHGKGSTPSAKALACYSGHVAVVEAVSGNQILISEGGNTSVSASNGYCAIRWMTAPTVGTSYGDTGTFLGYVYLNECNVVNKGDKFYANIVRVDGWKELSDAGGDDCNVEITDATDGSNVWLF